MPSATDILVQLAQRDLASGQLDAAAAKCRQVLSAHPKDAGALDILGTVSHAQGRYAQAVEAFTVLTHIQPTSAVHWEHLGTVLRAVNRHDDALQAFARALQLGPPSVGLLYNLGALQMDRCDLQAAYLALRDASALQPRNALIRWAFAQCCCDLARRDEACAAVQDWQHFEGLSSEILVRIALLLITTGGAALAQPVIERLLANPPQSGPPALSFASLLERLNRTDEARALLQRLDASADIDAHDVDRQMDKQLLWAALADREGAHEQAYQHLTAALKLQRQPVRRHQLLFQLAGTCDALARHEEAFAACEEAHRAQLEFIARATGDASVTQSPVWSLAENRCLQEDVATWGDEGPDSEHSPVFIVGFPRSGTTLLEQALDAHPGLVSMDEQWFLAAAVEDIRMRGIRYPLEMGRLNAQALEGVRARYWQRVHTRISLVAGQRLLDKNPNNMLLLPLIKRLFPRAHIILTIRHPCDTVLSCFMQHFQGDLALLCRDLGTISRAYGDGFGFWYSQWPLLRPQSCELRYEQLIADFATELRRLSDFLQIRWHEAMLAPGEHARNKLISTPSYAQVVQPISNRHVGRWKPYASHFATALPILQPWIDRWGYSVV